MKRYDSYGSKIEVDGNSVFIKQAFMKKNFDLNEVENVIKTEPTTMKNGMVSFIVKGQAMTIFFTKAHVDDMNDFYKLLTDNCIPINDSSPSIFIGNAIVDYMGGHPEIPKNGSCIITVFSDYIELSVGRLKKQIKISQIENVNFETQDQIERRYTVTRMLAIGVFALAFKKKKKTNEKYLTIEFSDDIGIQNVVLLQGKNAQKAHSLIYTSLSSYKKINTTKNIEQQEIPTQVVNDPYEEIKKAKELLDMGILTQEEFDKKKKELLGL